MRIQGEQMMRVLVLTLLLMPISVSTDLVAQNVALSAQEGVRMHDVPYDVPQVPWDAQFGRHRACVHVEQAADAVRVLVPWRRRDHDAAEKNVIIIDATTHQRVKNLVRVHVEREYGILLFQP
jgi:glycosyl hydrolase family 123